MNFINERMTSKGDALQEMSIWARERGLSGGRWEKAATTTTALYNGTVITETAIKTHITSKN